MIAGLVALGAGSGGARAERRHALVIGANPGWAQDRPLRYAENDAERVRDVLVSLGGFAPERVALLRDPDAADVRAALRELASKARDSSAEDTLVFVYYSGHADDQYLHLRYADKVALSHRELQDALRGMPATIRLAVIDACKSGAVTRKGGTAAAPFDVDVVNPKLSGMVLLTSSGADELSQESRALAGSVFTHHLVSGLHGAADDNADQQITVAEAYRYAYERTRADTATTGAVQRPAFRYELSGQGDLVLTRLAAAQRATLRVPAGAPHKYVVLDEHGWRLIAEARAAPEREVALSLAPGSYVVKHVLDDRLDVARVALAPGVSMALDRMSYRTEPLSAGIVKGDPNDLPWRERHEWARSRAFGALNDGEVAAALNMFDALLREMPGDTEAWRGRGRALVRMAEAYARVNDEAKERLALIDALRSDPSLTRDPQFQGRYRAFVDRIAREQTAMDDRLRRAEQLRATPRVGRRLGIGFDFLSARGVIGVSGRARVHRMVFASAGADFIYKAADLAAVIVPMSSRWSPFAGIGGHVGLRKLGFDVGAIGDGVESSGFEDLGAMLELHARAEVGAQFVGASGITIELGFAGILYQTTAGKTTVGGFPIFHFGWLF